MEGRWQAAGSKGQQQRGEWRRLGGESRSEWKIAACYARGSPRAVPQLRARAAGQFAACLSVCVCGEAVDEDLQRRLAGH